MDGWTADRSGGKLVRIGSRRRSDQTLPVFFQRKVWGNESPVVGFGGCLGSHMLLHARYLVLVDVIR